MSQEQKPEGPDAPKVSPEIDNRISGGEFNGPVGQFGAVHGDVNYQWSAPPKSQRELEFRARYMRKAEEAWEAEERKRAAEKAEENRDPLEKFARKGLTCIGYLVIVALLFFAFFLVAPHVIKFMVDHAPPPEP